jgi:hypothetical protein
LRRLFNEYEEGECEMDINKVEKALAGELIWRKKDGAYYAGKFAKVVRAHAHWDVFFTKREVFMGRERHVDHVITVNSLREAKYIVNRKYRTGVF